MEAWNFDVQLEFIRISDTKVTANPKKAKRSKPNMKERTEKSLRRLYGKIPKEAAKAVVKDLIFRCPFVAKRKVLGNDIHPGNLVMS